MCFQPTCVSYIPFPSLSRMFLYFLYICIVLLVLNGIDALILHLLLFSWLFFFFFGSMALEITHINHVDDQQICMEIQCTIFTDLSLLLHEHNTLHWTILFLIGTQVVSLLLLPSLLFSLIHFISNNIALNICVHVPLHIKQQFSEGTISKLYCYLEGKCIFNLLDTAKLSSKTVVPVNRPTNRLPIAPGPCWHLILPNI